MSAVLRTERFHAMGCDCAISVTAPPGLERASRRARAAGRAEVDACERALSRFDARSDLSRANAGAGDWVAVGPRLLGALRAALDAREATGGRFDPTILPALVAAGYDRSFEALTPRAPRVAADWRPGAAVDLDDAAGLVRVERGAAIDLGGIAKGWTAARALEAMRDAWAHLLGGLVDLGGDLAVWGRPPGGGRWLIAVADPRTPGGTLATLEVVGGGVATSGRDRRRFGPGGALHHLIDPSTGAPARGGPLAVTALAGDAAGAEVHASVLALAGPAEAAAYVAARADLSALVVPETGAPTALGTLPLAERRRVRLTVAGA